MLNPTFWKVWTSQSEVAQAYFDVRSESNFVCRYLSPWHRILATSVKDQHLRFGHNHWRAIELSSSNSLTFFSGGDAILFAPDLPLPLTVLSPALIAGRRWASAEAAGSWKKGELKIFRSIRESGG